MRNDFNIDVYFDRGPRGVITFSGDFWTRLKLAWNLLRNDPSYVSITFEGDDMRRLFGQTGKVLRRMKKARADG